MTEAPAKKAPGRKPLPPGEGKDGRLQLRVSAADRAELQRKADAAGLPLSQWLIRAGLRARE